MKPNPNYIAELYSLAANEDVSAFLQLCQLYSDFVGEVVSEMKRKHASDLSEEELKIVGYAGIGESLKRLELGSDCRTYAEWVEKNIRLAVQREILRVKGLLPPELN